MARKKGDKANQQLPTSGTVVTTPSGPRLLTKRNAFAVLAVVVALLIGLGVWWHIRDVNNAKKTNLADEHALQTSLSLVSNSPDNQDIVAITTQLIVGAAAGSFKLSNSQLAQYHIDKAAALINLKQYNQAIMDSQAAANLDSGLKLPALQAEFEARYNVGQRTQLIPLLQQLIQLENNSGDPMRGSAIAQYQQDIQGLQHNQRIIVE
jgi:hypothetical protein